MSEPIDPGGPRRHAPATLRNREPLLSVLQRIFPVPAFILEVASGTGEHAAFFGTRLPHLTWQPSDIEPTLRASIDSWSKDVWSVRPALHLDASSMSWPVERADGVVSVNLLHIAPWAVCEGLLSGAARVLSPGGALVLYGPFREGGRHTAPSNEAFDADLRDRDPSWGVRDLEEVRAVAGVLGLEHEETVRMPANNLTVILRRS
ncbi:MAG: DUF938 domain-containing protein [Myxococcales bacterium]|nr:DUF938 domain-containing protein [Myxococcales bacterium]